MNYIYNLSKESATYLVNYNKEIIPDGIIIPVQV